MNSFTIINIITNIYMCDNISIIIISGVPLYFIVIEMFVKRSLCKQTDDERLDLVRLANSRSIRE